jgi:hypothetical protein
MFSLSFRTAAATTATIAGLCVTALPAAAQTLPANPELLCTGTTTSDRWGAGTAFPAKGKPPYRGVTGQFSKKYRIIPSESRVMESSAGGSYYDIANSMQSDGWIPADYNSVTPQGFSQRYTYRAQWDYLISSISVSRSADGGFTYSYLHRDEDRNNLIFTLTKSTGTCRLLNPV